MEGNEKGPVNTIHKCVDTNKKETSKANESQKQNSHHKNCRKRKESEKCCPRGRKLSFTYSFIYSFNNYVLSANQVLDKATKVKRQSLPTRSTVRRETFSGDQEEETILCLGECCILPETTWLRSFLGTQKRSEF